MPLRKGLRLQTLRRRRNFPASSARGHASIRKGDPKSSILSIFSPSTPDNVLFYCWHFSVLWPVPKCGPAVPSTEHCSSAQHPPLPLSPREQSCTFSVISQCFHVVSLPPVCSVWLGALGVIPLQHSCLQQKGRFRRAHCNSWGVVQSHVKKFNLSQPSRMV